MPRAFVLILLASMLIANAASAQTGRWVSHDKDIVGNGYLMEDVGRTCAAITRDTSAQLRFFGIQTATWTDVDMDFEQDWSYLAAEGHVALAVSDSFLVAYNATNGNAHPLRYEGNILENFQGTQTLGCAGQIAYVATDAHIYVFDAVIDDWQTTTLTLPADYTYGRGCVGDDFMGLSLQRSSSVSAWSHAYSLHAHAFAYTDQGCVMGPVDGVLAHGFAGSDYGYPELWLVGYSAFTNTFVHELLPLDYTSFQDGIANWNGQEKRTVYAAKCAVSGAEPRVFNFWGYDTVRGSFTHKQVTYDADDWSYGYNIDFGGRYAATAYLNEHTDEISYIVYSGFTGAMLEYGTGIYNSSLTSVTGGTTFVALERNERAWGLDVEGERSAVLPLGDEDVTGIRTQGTDYSLFSAWRYDEDTMDVHAYHGPTNSWSSVTEPKYTAYNDTGTNHLYSLVRLNAVVDALFYSGRLGAFTQIDMPYSLQRPYSRSSDLFYMYCQTPATGCLYDARRNQVHYVDYQFDYDGVGDGVFVGGDPVTQTAWGFSEITNTWASYDVGETLRYGAAGEQVGWMSDSDPSIQVVAFNGVHANWVPLDTGAAADDVFCGDRTILVTDWYGYHAFDPQGPIVPIEDPGTPEITPERPAALALHPVHPNPFNPTTRVAFALPRPGAFSLRVHDLRGRVVRTLAEGVAPAGTHTASWNGRDDSGRELPSGTYVIRLEAERHVVTQRATLLK